MSGLAEIVPLASATAGKSAPIESLRVYKDAEAGPFLLLCTGRPGRHWVIGSWDGSMWEDRDGYPISPIRWCPLPEIEDESVLVGT